MITFKDIKRIEKKEENEMITFKDIERIEKNFEWDGTILALCAAARRGVEADHELQNAFEDVVTRAERAEAAIVKLVGAIDMIRETIHGGNVQDLLLIINSSLDEGKKCLIEN
jgi:hypothetical protein